jgi:hypothetical protein
MKQICISRDNYGLHVTVEFLCHLEGKINAHYEGTSK